MTIQNTPSLTALCLLLLLAGCSSDRSKHSIVEASEIGAEAQTSNTTTDAELIISNMVDEVAPHEDNQRFVEYMNHTFIDENSKHQNDQHKEQVLTTSKNVEQAKNATKKFQPEVEQVEDETKEPQMTLDDEKHAIDILQSKQRAPNVNLPVEMPSIQAPKYLKHPLSESMEVIFLLGEDQKGYYLYGEGSLTEGTFVKFQRYIAHYQSRNIKLNRLMIHSPGGLMKEAMKIGRYMQEHGWTSDSDKYMRCYSACGFIYASGVAKRMQNGAKVGFHRPYLPNREDTPEMIYAMYDRYLPYWKEINGDLKLFDKFMKNYGRDDMLILTTENANQYFMADIYK
ncbi:hypothetical protein [Aliivibrio kagoshimensis]|uniref:hypothetical protein n=1 Tax=Aliivibrio kagoshimensis TaxID=2910230 RepID=UPI003D12CBDF